MEAGDKVVCIEAKFYRPHESPKLGEILTIEDSKGEMFISFIEYNKPPHVRVLWNKKYFAIYDEEHIDREIEDLIKIIK